MVRKVLVVVVVHFHAAVRSRTGLYRLLAAVVVAIGRRGRPAQMLRRIVEAGRVIAAIVVTVQIELVPIRSCIAIGSAERR